MCVKKFLILILVLVASNVAFAQGLGYVKNKPIIIHPNPAVDFVDFTKTEESTVHSVWVNDITGRLVAIKYFQEGEQKVTIDLSAWRGGIYIIQFFDDNNKVVSRQKLEVAKK